MVREESLVDELIDGWEYWCPDKSCRNRTFSVASASGSYFSGKNRGDEQYLKVRVLSCNRCHKPLVIGTYTYRNDSDGWGARGEKWTSAELKMLAAVTMTSSSRLPMHPIEYIAFLEPAEERELPSGLNKEIVSSFREAEYAVGKNKPISAAAAIRNTVRLIVEDNSLDAGNLKDAIKKLPFDKVYRDALGDLKIVGDDSMHYEEYEVRELRPALEVLALALNDHASRKESIAQLRKAVGDKRSDKGKRAKSSATSKTADKSS